MNKALGNNGSLLCWLVGAGLAPADVQAAPKAAVPVSSPARLVRVTAHGEQTPQGRAHTLWLWNQWEQVKRVQPGMTRREFLRLFRRPGGAYGYQGPSEPFVLRECPLISVRARFFSSANPSGTQEASADRLVELSAPFLSSPEGAD